MTNKKFINLITELKCGFENQMTVQIYNFSMANSCESARIEAATLIAQTCRNVKTKNPERLYKKLMTEHAGKPSEVIQFIPVKVYEKDYDKYFDRENIRFSYDTGCSCRLTNLRCNPDLPYNKSYEIDNYFVFKIQAPLFVAWQLARHGQLAFNQQSSRFVKNDKYYMIPELSGYGIEKFNQIMRHTVTLNNWRKLNIAADYAAFPCKLRMTEFWIAGWYEDPSTWSNLFAVRKQPSAQRETRIISKAMWELIIQNGRSIIGITETV